MANWINATTMDRTEVRVNLDHVAMIRPHHSDRGFTGSEILFSGGAPSSILVREDRDTLIGSPVPRQISQTL
jgi:hypothetical protein